ncbi:transforming growth factor-beta-induced protein ig-h3-like [Lineus longissimus]|uniref:transforming growth factor-beta-induced protein ig-h3-like n=1 Tax=Lineus longissimus TaxID=88925 RepID=UPI002B4E1933
MKLFILAVFCISQVLCAEDWYFPYELHDSAWTEEVKADRPKDLVEVAKKLRLNKLIEYLTFAGLADTIKTGGPFTVFAPSDKAFDEMLRCPYLKKELFANKTRVAELLTYHVISGEVLSKQLSNELLAPSLLKVDGKAINIRVNIYDKGKIVTATGSKVVKVDQKASNGVIHVIDKVMFPVPVSDIVTVLSKFEKVSSTLVTAVKAAGLVETLQGEGPFTLFAPSNRAFAKLPKEKLDDLLNNKTALADLLTYHVVAGTIYSDGIDGGLTSVPTVEGKSLKILKCPWSGRVSVNGANVWGPNLSVSNGVIHLIDAVLIPPPVEKETTSENKPLPWMQLKKAFGVGVQRMEQFGRL